MSNVKVERSSKEFETNIDNAAKEDWRYDKNTFSVSVQRHHLIPIEVARENIDFFQDLEAVTGYAFDVNHKTNGVYLPNVVGESQLHEQRIKGKYVSAHNGSIAHIKYSELVSRFIDYISDEMGAEQTELIEQGVDLRSARKLSAERAVIRIENLKMKLLNSLASESESDISLFLNNKDKRLEAIYINETGLDPPRDNIALKEAVRGFLGEKNDKIISEDGVNEKLVRSFVGKSDQGFIEKFDKDLNVSYVSRSDVANIVEKLNDIAKGDKGVNSEKGFASIQLLFALGVTSTLAVLAYPFIEKTEDPIADLIEFIKKTDLNIDPETVFDLVEDVAVDAFVTKMAQMLGGPVALLLTAKEVYEGFELLDAALDLLLIAFPDSKSIKAIGKMRDLLAQSREVTKEFELDNGTPLVGSLGFVYEIIQHSSSEPLSNTEVANLIYKLSDSNKKGAETLVLNLEKLLLGSEGGVIDDESELFDRLIRVGNAVGLYKEGVDSDVPSISLYDIKYIGDLEQSEIKELLKSDDAQSVAYSVVNNLSFYVTGDLGSRTKSYDTALLLNDLDYQADRVEFYRNMMKANGLNTTQMSSSGQRTYYKDHEGSAELFVGDYPYGPHSYLNEIDHVEFGGLGSDNLIGGDEEDRLHGAGGSDTLSAGDDSNPDFLYGGGGFDTYKVFDNDYISDSDHQGEVFLDGVKLTGGVRKENDPANQYISEDGRYTYNLEGGNLSITGPNGHYVEVVNYNADISSLGIRLEDEEGEESAINYDATTSGTSGRDVILPYYFYDSESHVKEIDEHFDDEPILIEEALPTLIQGYSGRDVLIGTGYSDYIYATSRPETTKLALSKEGESENRGDFLGGFSGDDHLYGSDLADVLHGGHGDDKLYGGAGNDRFFGDIHAIPKGLNNNLNGVYESLDVGYWNVTRRGGSDYIVAGAGHDHASGQGGDDELFGGEGDDTLRGDLSWIVNFELHGAFHGSDSIYGGAGNDEIYGDGGNDKLIGGDGNDKIYGDWDQDEHSVSDKYQGTDHIYGGAGDDRIRGNGGVDYLYGGEGNDYIRGDDEKLAPIYHGNDFLFGGAGKDRLIGDLGDDVLEGGEDDDLLYGDRDEHEGMVGGSDYLAGGAGNDLLLGGFGEDTLEGGEGDDHLYGDHGDLSVLQGSNDKLRGGDGSDALYGEEGDDLLEGEDGNDMLIGGGGEDTLEGGEGDDTLYGDLGDASTQEGANDKLRGGHGSDVLYGEKGDDLLEGQDGNDSIYGGLGSDKLVGGLGADFLSGQEGDDTYLLEIGNGAIVGGTIETIEDNANESNRIIFGAGIGLDDIGGTLQGEDLILSYGRDYIWINNGLDGAIDSFEFTDSNRRIKFYDLVGSSIYEPVNRQGGYGNDVLIGGALNDYVEGGSGNDLLAGGLGDDVIKGGEGDDTIISLGGFDQLSGGEGEDLYEVNLDREGDVVIEDPSVGNRLVIKSSESVSNVLINRSGDDVIISSGDNKIRVRYWNDLLFDSIELPSGELLTGNAVQESINDAPIAKQPGNNGLIGVVAGEYFKLDLNDSVFEDPEDDQLYYEIQSDGGELPSWLTLDQQNGAIYGTPGKNDIGDRSIVVKAVDKGGLQSEAYIDLKIRLTSEGLKANDDFFEFNISPDLKYKIDKVSFAPSSSFSGSKYLWSSDVVEADGVNYVFYWISDKDENGEYSNYQLWRNTINDDGEVVGYPDLITKEDKVIEFAIDEDQGRVFITYKAASWERAGSGTVVRKIAEISPSGQMLGLHDYEFKEDCYISGGGSVYNLSSSFEIVAHENGSYRFYRSSYTDLWEDLRHRPSFTPMSNFNLEYVEVSSGNIKIERQLITQIFSGETSNILYLSDELLVAAFQPEIDNGSIRNFSVVRKKKNEKFDLSGLDVLAIKALDTYQDYNSYVQVMDAHPISDKEVVLFVSVVKFFDERLYDYDPVLEDGTYMMVFDTSTGQASDLFYVSPEYTQLYQSFDVISTKGGDTVVVVTYTDESVDSRLLKFFSLNGEELHSEYMPSDNEQWFSSQQKDSVRFISMEDGARLSVGETVEYHSVDIENLAQSTGFIIDPLVNDVGDNLILRSLNILSGFGSVEILDNKIFYDASDFYDYLSGGESADVRIGYSVENEFGQLSDAVAEIKVNGSGDSGSDYIRWEPDGNNSVYVAGEGDDYIFIHPGDGSSEKISVDSGGGDDVLIVKRTGSKEFVLKGGDGNDRYRLNGSGFSYKYGTKIFIDDSRGRNSVEVGVPRSRYNPILGLGSLKITFENSGVELHLENFDPNDVYGGPRDIDSLRFSDVTLTYEELVALGFDITGDASDNTLTGTSVVDRIQGAAGDDLLQGGEGDDVYIFDLGSGRDIIEDDAGINSIQLRSSLSINDISFRVVANDLQVRLSSDDSVTVKNWVNLKDSSIGQIDAVDGSLNSIEIEALLIPNAMELSNISDVLLIEDEELQDFNIYSFLNAGHVIDSVEYVDIEDGTTPGWLKLDLETGQFSGIPTNTDVGVHQYRLRVYNTLGEVAETTFKLEVRNVNDTPESNIDLDDQSVTEDSLFSFTLNPESFIDVDPGDKLSYRALLADGSELPNWVEFDPETLTFTGTPINEDVGDLIVKVEVSDLSGATAEQAFTLSVTNTNDAPQVRVLQNDLNIMQGEFFSKSFGVEDFIDIDVGDHLTYQITQEDGSALPDWLGFNENSLLLQGTPEGEDVGVLTLKLTAIDKAGSGASDLFSIYVEAKQEQGLELYGDYRNETLSGGSGNDSLYGMNGNDVLSGGLGNDLLNGGIGNDVLEGDEGDDNLNGEIGNDRLLGGSGNDILSGEIGNDQLDGGIGNDQLSGGIGNDILKGGEGDDLISGGIGNDRLYGGVGDDQISGGSGNDHFYGGEGNDQLSGGDGSDIYFFDHVEGFDTIADTQGRDAIFLQSVRSADDLNFYQLNDDLIVTENGQDGSLRVTEWFTDSSVERIQTRTQNLYENDVHKLVTAIASFDVQSGVGEVSSGQNPDDKHSVQLVVGQV